MDRKNFEKLDMIHPFDYQSNSTYSSLDHLYPVDDGIIILLLFI